MVPYLKEHCPFILHPAITDRGMYLHALDLQMGMMCKKTYETRACSSGMAACTVFAKRKTSLGVLTERGCDELCGKSAIAPQTRKIPVGQSSGRRQWLGIDLVFVYIDGFTSNVSACIRAIKLGEWALSIFMRLRRVAVANARLKGD